MEGEWLDRYVVALAEWGARLQGKGYQLQDPEDSHPLAWYRMVDPETGAEVDAVGLKQVWVQTRKHLVGFPGRTRDIQGRSYLHFQDYLRWLGRKPTGDLQSRLRRRGLVLSGWNRWVVGNGNRAATLEGVHVSSMSSFLEGCRYQLCRDETEEAEEQRRRESLLRDLRGWQPGTRSKERYLERIDDWKGMASDFLCDLYSLRQAAEAISHRYFDGRQLLFPAHTRSLARLVEVVEELVTGYNEDIDNELVQETGPAPDGLDGARAPNSIDIAFLVDMARAEALDAMGEIQAAVAIVDRQV